jgi:hypothetical protein
MHWCFFSGCENNCVSVSPNVTVDNGLVCPEPTELTCRTYGDIGTDTLRWTNGSTIIEPLTYTFQGSDQFLFPITRLAENRSSAFVSYVIEDVMFVPGVEFNFTAVLVVNPELMVSSGYPSIHCGGVSESDSFIISQIDMESEQVQCTVSLV